MQLEDLDLHAPEEVHFKKPESTGKLSDLDLEKELLEQFQTTKEYLNSILDTDSFSENVASPNQVASVMNSLNAVMRDIVKMQTDLYNAERQKIFEAVVIQIMKKAPPDVQESFMSELEKTLGGVK